MRDDHKTTDDGVLTAPLRLPSDRTGDDEPVVAAEKGAAIARVDPAPVGAFTKDVDRLGELVERLSAAAATLGDRLDGEVRGVLGKAESALAEARAARQAAADADARTAQAEADAEAARMEAADARAELQEGLAAAKASVAAAQESEAGAWKEAGAHQQARATAANEAASAEGLRKRAEAAWSNEHQARTDAERERDDLAARLAVEQTALATARSELAEAKTELAEVRAKLEEAADTERRLRAELSTAQGEIAGLTVERDSVASRAAELATRADRAEQLADTAESRIETERKRADRAEQRADDAEVRINRDAATVRALHGLPSMVPAVRAFVRGLLHECPRRDDAELIASEFAANAIRHTPSGGPGGHLLVTVTVRPGWARVAVSDAGTGVWARPAPLPDMVSEYGRGLHIIEQTADKLGHDISEDGQTVWAELVWSGA